MSYAPLTATDKQLKVTYTGGLGTNTADVVANYSDLALACEMQCRALLRDRDVLGATSVSVAGSAVSFNEPGGWLAEVKRLLDRYRI